MATFPTPTVANIDVPAGSMRQKPSGGISKVRWAFIIGGAAGNLTVTGINTNDTLLGVAAIGVTTGPVFNAADDLTGEFSITAANTINNTGGTATTSKLVIVAWEDSDYGDTVAAL